MTKFQQVFSSIPSVKKMLPLGKLEALGHKSNDYLSDTHSRKGFEESNITSLDSLSQEVVVATANLSSLPLVCE